MIRDFFRLLSLVFAIMIFGVVTASADTLRASCGFRISQFISGDSVDPGPPSASITCSDERFGSLTSQSYIDGTKLGAFTGIDWTVSPRIPDEYAANALAQLTERMFIPGTGTGTITVTLPVHGLIAESDYWDQYVRVILQAGDLSGSTNGNYWEHWYQSTGGVNDTFVIPLDVPRGEWFTFFTVLALGGGRPFSPGSDDPNDSFANFMNTAEVSITRLQDASGADLPLTSLQVESNRNFTPGATTTVPEPATLALLGLGLAGLAGWGLRRKSR